MATMIHRIRGADHARHERLETLLSKQDDTRRSRRRVLRNCLPTAASGVMDVEEHALDAEEQGIGFSVLELTSQTVQDIEAALRRLEAGELGACSDCRSRISGARLRALPFAALCRGCQEKQDIAATSVAGWGTVACKERLASTIGKLSSRSSQASKERIEQVTSDMEKRVRYAGAAQEDSAEDQNEGLRGRLRAPPGHEPGDPRRRDVARGLLLISLHVGR